MSKFQYEKYKKEILEMHSQGKSTAEIAEIINNKYNKSDIMEFSERATDDKVKMQALKGVSQLLKELHNTFVIFSIINEEFGRAIDALQARNRRNILICLLLGGLFLIALALGMIAGYQDSHPGEAVSFLYSTLFKSLGIGILIGLVFSGIIIKINKITRRKKL